MHAEAGDILCIIFNFPYITQNNIELDELHIIYLGVLQYFLGSVLWLLVHQILPGRPAKNMFTLWQKVVASYQLLGTRSQYNNLVMGSFIEDKKSRTSYPRLKGSGAECKGLVRPILAIMQELRRPRNNMDRLIIQFLNKMAFIQESLDEYHHDMFLPKGVAHNIQCAVKEQCLEYVELARLADTESLLLFSIVPKLHWYFHWVERVQYTNPRRGACQVDEDFVGRMKVICHSVMSGSPLEQMPSSALEKWRWGFHCLRYETPRA